VAAKALGWETISVVRTDLAGLEAAAYAIADNRTSDLSEFDTLELSKLLQALHAEDALDGVGFSEKELNAVLDEIIAAGASLDGLIEDQAPALPDAAVTRPGDLWILGRHRLLCGDSAKREDVDRLLDGARIQLVNTDPPYNVKVEPRSNNAIAAGLSSFTATHHQGLDLARHPSKATPIHQRDLELAGLASVEGMNMPLAELRDAYLSDLSVRVGSKQLRSVTDSLNRILAWLPAQRVRDVRAVDVLRFRAERVKAGASNRTANVDVAALKAALRWAVEVQLIAESPLRQIKRLPSGEAHQVCRRRAMTDAEIEAFLAAAAADDARNQPVVSRRRLRRDVARRFQLVGRRGRARVPQLPLWTALVSLGMRYGEARTLTWGDVDLDGCALTLRPENTKTHRARLVPITREFAGRLAELRKLHARALRRVVGAGDRVFLSPEGRPLRVDTVNARRILARLLEAAGIARRDSTGRKLDIHALRGTCASRLARRGVGVALTAKLLGHSTIEMTLKHYTKLDLADLRHAVETNAPIANRREESA
jgi:integrase